MSIFVKLGFHSLKRVRENHPENHRARLFTFNNALLILYSLKEKYV